MAAAFLFPLTVSAVTLTEYQLKLKQAIAALNSLEKIGDQESESEFKNRLLQSIDTVRAALPEHMTVEDDGDVCQVNNSSLYKTLEDLKSLSIEAQFKKINEVKATLQTLEARIAERIAGTPQGETAEQAKLRLATILARPEFATGPRNSSALLRFIEDFVNWIRSFFPQPRGLAGPARLDRFPGGSNRNRRNRDRARLRSHCSAAPVWP